MLLLIYAHILLFCIYAVICFRKFKNLFFFYILFFIFKISTYKKYFKLIERKASSVTFFLTTRYLSQEAGIGTNRLGLELLG